jgi:hypothetical protein
LGKEKNMSTNIVGTIDQSNLADYKVVGSQGITKDMDITTESINGQRPTVAKRVQQLLDKEGGFRWELFSPILIAYIKEIRDHRIIDGDHRRHMMKATMPSKTLIPAHVIELETEEEGNDLFEEINKSRKTSVSPEDLFFNAYQAKKPEAIEYSKVLSTLRMRVTSQPDTYGQYCVPPGSAKPAIGIAAFKKMYKMCEGDMKPLARTSNLLEKNFGKEKTYRSELFQGLVTLFYIYGDSFDKSSKTENEFLAWFQANCPDQKKASMWKSLGGSVHHKEAECIAKGMLHEFRLIAKKRARDALVMRKINDAIEG